MGETVKGRVERGWGVRVGVGVGSEGVAGEICPETNHGRNREAVWRASSGFGGRLAKRLPACSQAHTQMFHIDFTCLGKRDQKCRNAVRLGPRFHALSTQVGHCFMHELQQCECEAGRLEALLHSWSCWSPDQEQCASLTVLFFFFFRGQPGAHLSSMTASG